MKNTKAYNTHIKFSLRQKLGKVSKTLNLRGLRLHTQSPSPLVPEYEWFRNQVINGAARSNVATSIVARALIAACALLLLLFSCIGAVEGIAKAQANALHVLSVPPSAVKPTRTPPGRHTPTPVPTTPIPSPTLAVTLTTMPTVLTNTTPSVQEALPQAAGKRGNQSNAYIDTNTANSLHDKYGLAHIFLSTKGQLFTFICHNSHFDWHWQCYLSTSHCTVAATEISHAIYKGEVLTKWRSTMASSEKQ
jgi:hypothetical protein